MINTILVEFFIRKMDELYGCTYPLARDLYLKWGIYHLTSEAEIEDLVKSKEVQNSVRPHKDLSLVALYSREQLLARQIELRPEAPETGAYVDTKFGYQWQLDVTWVDGFWVDRYRIVKPAYTRQVLAAKTLIET